ncbi:hypothetical protein [Nocardia altamirensis]|uniref:hypothetical protein n=1 Tax=Nocardia altamirensis TaxID=472158 RepID=UPI0008408F67|nr:hypothetical protein [Nocardia altamirensis]
MTETPIAAGLLAQLADEPPPKIILNWGLGADSSAALLYLIEHPEVRDWALEELCVVTAMVGDEWTQTGLDASDCVLPVLRANGIRYIQLARSQRKTTKAGLGVRVLDDSRTPQMLHFSGHYRLSDEMITAGTIPQTGGSRLCSVHAKGQVIDPVLAAITRGQPFRQLIGYEATELARAIKDTRYNTTLRTGEYPLIDWEWDRAAAEEYLLKTTGRQWIKSACVFCPYSLATAAGRAATFAKFREHPAAGARMLWIEHIALCLNPKQGLIGGRRAIDYIVEAELTEVLDQFRAALHTSEHAVYELRRLTKPAADPAKKGVRWRAVRAIAHGTRTDMLAHLEQLPGTTELGEDAITRRIVRDGTYTIDGHAEHFYVAGPAGVEDRKRPGFEMLWRTATLQRHRHERIPTLGYRGPSGAPRTRSLLWHRLGQSNLGHSPESDNHIYTD